MLRHWALRLGGKLSSVNSWDPDPDPRNPEGNQNPELGPHKPQFFPSHPDTVAYRVEKLQLVPQIIFIYLVLAPYNRKL